MSASPQAFHQYYENVSFRLLQRVSELWNPKTACVDCLLHKYPGANPILSTLEGAEWAANGKAMTSDGKSMCRSGSLFSIRIGLLLLVSDSAD